VAVPLGAALVWQYRNAAYLLPAIPALAIVAASYGPLAGPRHANAWIALCGAAFLVKAAFPAAPWGLEFRSGTVQASAPALSAYCERARGNELMVVDLRDDLYASVLPVARLRYCLVGAPAPAGPYGMDFASMGIILPAAQFDDLARWEPFYR